MPGIDTQEIKKNVLKKINDSSFKCLITNPLLLSILITGIILLIVVYMFKPEDKKSRIRSGVYIFLTVSISIFVHNSVIMKGVDSTLGAGEFSNMSDIAGGDELTISGLDYLKVS